ncbi:phytoene desaturase family protein [Plantibacter sp. Mn2098]|uniref:phytoene desaturase family protein n=1 Tax=Plantibacter sp. Mn2098 TaxID=3395266 RepID=UPI003BD69900
MNAPRTIVIGGGISGLATAALLARDGQQVTLIEKRDVLGGRAGVWEADGFTFDTGPSWYLMPEVFDHFYRLLGTSSAEQLDLGRLDPAYRVYSEGEDAPLDLAANRADNIALFETVEAGAGARMDEYLRSARETYDIAIRTFLYTTFQSYRTLVTPEVLARTPKLVSLLREDLDSFAAKTVSDPRLRQILGYPAVFLGSSPYAAPSMYHLMSYLDLEDGVLYPQGGFTRIIETIADLARAEGVEIITGAEALGITTVPGRGGSGDAAGGRNGGGRRRGRGARVAGVAYRGADGKRRLLRADRVVSAADLHHTETTLLPPELQTYPESYWEQRTAGPGAVLVMLGVRGDLPELLHHSLFFTADWHDNFGRIFGEEPSVPDPASLYVCKPSASDAGVAPDGHENLFILVPVPADPGIGGGGDERVRAIGDAAIEQIAAWAGIPDLAERIVVRRDVGPADFQRDLNVWKGTALGPAHILSQSAMFRARNVSTKVDGLYYTGGSTTPGIGLPMCLISAELVVKRMRGDVSTGPMAEPLRPAGAGADA